MLSKRIIAPILLTIIFSTIVHSQETIGIFFHGFQGNSEKWTEISEVPIKWKNQEVIDDYIALDYETSELEDKNVEALVRRLVSEIAFEAGRKGYSLTNDRWILIGHSLGGLVARSIYPRFKSSLKLNMVAVISIAGPMQGAGATEVTSSDVDRRLSDMEEKISKAFQHKIGLIDFGVDFLDFVNGTNYRNRIDAIPKYIGTARDSALGYVGHIEEHKANALIGRDGSLIDEINGYRETDSRNHPPQFLSVIGAEKAKIPIRIAGQIYTDAEELKNEQKLVEQLTKLRDDYFYKHEKWYNGLFNASYLLNIQCRIRHPLDLFNKCQVFENRFKKNRKYREEWKAAKREIDNIDVTWGELINSYKINTVYYQEYLPPCENNGGGPDIPYIIREIEPVDCSSDPGGEYITKTTQVEVPTKNDGVITIESGLWSKNDKLVDDHNRYFSDIPEDGGYNHFELRNYARQYTLPGVFKEGDKNPSMQAAENWIKSSFSF
jgi:hypothetical protein